MAFGLGHRKRKANGDDRPGAAPQPLGRVAGIGEDPLTWAIPLVTWRGVRIGVHAIFPIWALAECAAALPRGRDAVFTLLTAAACYLVVVLARELARAWWAARAGREVHEIVAWPLGGFASSGAASARATAMGELGGVVFTAILAVPLGGFLWALGVHLDELAVGILVPSAYPHTRDPIEAVVFWSFHASVVLTAFNALVPMAPFDVAHAIDRLHAPERSPVDAAGSSLRRGLFMAFVLFTGAAVASAERVMAVAMLGGLTTWIEYRRVMFLHRPLLNTILVEDRAASINEPHDEDVRESNEAHSALPQVDEVLAKITRSGLTSLSAKERRSLEEATRRSRGESAHDGTPGG